MQHFLPVRLREIFKEIALINTLKILFWALAILCSLFLFSPRFVSLVFAWLAEPDHEFGTGPTPDAPNYSLISHWAAWPDESSPAERVPEGIDKVPQEDRLAEAFFLHPNTYGGKAHWVQPLDDEMTRRETDLGTISRQASVFNKCCRVYAPRYRQAGFVGNKDLRGQLSDLAYSDIRSAFRYFLSEIGPDAPILLAGHSQGTFHLVRLLMEEVDGKPVMDRLVAVYAIGHSLPHSMLEEAYEDIKLCETANQIGCLVSWDAHESDKFPSPWSYIEEEELWNGKDYGGFPPSRRICINPITWQSDAIPSEKNYHLGALTLPKGGKFDLGSVSDPLPSLIKGSVSVFCEQGERSKWLMVNSDRDPMLKASGLWAFFERNLHGYDYSLFWGNIRENAEDRALAYLNWRGAEKH